MIESGNAVLFLRVGMLAGVGVLSWRLYQMGLHHKYRVFSAYLLFWILRSVVLMKLGVRSVLYAKVYIVTEPIVWLFYILLLLELYSLVLEKHKGLYSLGRWTLYGAMGVAVLVSTLIFIPPSGGTYAQSVALSYIFLLKRGLFCSLVIFLLLIIYVLTRYPIPLSRNVIIHSIVYSVFFLSNTLGSLFLSMLGRSVTEVVNLLMTVVQVACIGIWLRYLTLQGETVTMTAHRVWEPGQEERLVSQLNSLNSALIRAARTRT